MVVSVTRPPCLPGSGEASASPVGRRVDSPDRLIDQLFGLKLFNLNDVYKGAGSTVYASYSTVGIVSTVVALRLILPTIAVSVRRLHDTNHSGWWWWLQLLNFLCFIGTLILIFAFYIRESDPGENRYGPPPSMAT